MHRYREVEFLTGLLCDGRPEDVLSAMRATDEERQHALTQIVPYLGYLPLNMLDKQLCDRADNGSVSKDEYAFLAEHYPAFVPRYRTDTGYLVFEHGADLYMLLTPGKQVMVSKGWNLAAN